MKKTLICALLVGMPFVLCIYALLGWWIVSDVKAVCVQVTRKYPGDKVDALIAYMGSDTHLLKQRNRAIWAAGHLRDRRALLALEKLYTGESCDHRGHVCQYEVKKAIDKINDWKPHPWGWAWRFIES